jgi:ferredoxin--NADP+ reductase
MLKYKLKILDVIQEAEGTKTFHLEKPEGLSWEEGAHTHIGLAGFDRGEFPNKGLVRHMSISTLTKEKVIGFTTRVPGSGSQFKRELGKLKIGDEMTLFKMGSRMGLKREGRPIILLSMGVGIATMRPLILSYLENPNQISALWQITIDSSGDFIFKKELEDLGGEAYQNRWCTDRMSFAKELDTVCKLPNAIYYIVGSDDFLKETILKVKVNQIKEEDIVLDKKQEMLPEFFISLLL